MKNILLILPFIINFKVAQAQSDADVMLLSSLDKKNMFYVELRGQHGTVFKIGRWLDVAGRGYSILYTDTLRKRGAANDFSFLGKRTAVQQVNNKLYLVIEENFQNLKPIEIRAIDHHDPAYTTINNAYWWDNFLKLCEHINSTYKWQHYSFRNGFGLWNSFDNKSVSYRDFRVYADNRVRMLKDSIAGIHAPRDLLTSEVIKNIGTIAYSPLKDSLLKLPVTDASVNSYFVAIVNSVSNNRPELFFKLAEEMPDRKELMFDAVYDKAAVKKLKAVDTDAEVKKEFLKAKKKEKGFVVRAIAIAAAGAALLGFSIYVLVR